MKREGVNTVVQHKPGGLFGRVVDDRYELCGKYETAVEFWQQLMDDHLPVQISGYICVPTADLIPIDGGAPLVSATYERAMREQDDAISALRVINEECVLAGFPGGDISVTLANVRSLIYALTRANAQILELEDKTHEG